MRIRFAAESICAAAKGLSICQQLYVDLEPDDWLIPVQHFRRKTRRVTVITFDSSNAPGSNGSVLLNDFLSAGQLPGLLSTGKGSKILRQVVTPGEN